MGYRTLKECIDDLGRTGQLVRIEEEVDPHLEAAEIQRRVFRAGGPAVYYARVKGCRFPMVSNLFGTMERARYLFRDTLDQVGRLMKLGQDPLPLLKNPLKHARAATAGLHAFPRKVSTGPVMANETQIDQLPQIKSWPDDGGAYVLLPVVYSEHADEPGFRKSNLGMYRVQLSGGRYEPNREVGLHYQIHRGIGVHHEAAIRRGESFRVNVFVGGPPAMSLAAVMPLPEGMPELYLAGALGGRAIRMVCKKGQLPIHADADFCISCIVDPERKLPEGPFGDHLGYYSLAHDFPVLKVEKVYHRDGAIWPFTVVGRPPQEDSILGELIHEMTGPVIPDALPGVHAVHAVDAAGIHPLLLAVGSERYTPYRRLGRPQELLTQANAILGQGQLSLAKYLMICSRRDAPELDVHDIASFFRHLLERVDWKRDLHFQTCTTIDTLDYTGDGLNEGSKVVIAAVGDPVRELPERLSEELRMPEGFSEPRLCLPGVLCVAGPAHGSEDRAVERFCNELREGDATCAYPLVVIVDDSEFAAQSLDNFLWVTFTRSNPASDVYGVESSVVGKHWGCRGSLVIDARTKPHHAPPVIEDPDITKRVDELGAPGRPLHGII